VSLDTSPLEARPPGVRAFRMSGLVQGDGCVWLVARDGRRPRRECPRTPTTAGGVSSDQDPPPARPGVTMTRTHSQRTRDAAEYLRNRDIVLASHPECALCGGRRGPMIFEGDLDIRRWWLLPMAATADHIVPVSEGGSNALSNLRPAHRSCNSKRNRFKSLEEQPRRIRDFGRPRIGLYGSPTARKRADF